MPDNPGVIASGATGFWIENGEITYPVSELTVAGNLVDLCNQRGLQFYVQAHVLTIAPRRRQDHLRS